MTDLDIAGDLDIQNLEQEFEDDREPCSVSSTVEIFPGIIIPTGKCRNRATWFLMCPEDRSAETVCDEHRASILGWPDDADIHFDETCGHNPLVKDCIWEPYV
jgi:hypothetical protein